MGMFLNSNEKKLVSDIFINVGGEKKQVVSAWANKNKVPTLVYKKGQKIMTFFASIDNSYNSYIYKSTDLINWEIVKTYDYGLKFEYINDIVFAYNSAFLVSKDNGVTWSRIKSYTTPIKSLCYANGKYLFCVNKYVFEYNPDDDSITTFATATSSFECRYIVSFNNKALLIGDNICSALTESGWVTTDYNGQNKIPKSVCVGNDKVIVVTSSHLHYSYDGITWHSMDISNVGLSTVISSVVYVNKKWFATATSGNFLYISSDGLTWETITIPDLNIDAPIQICYGYNTYVFGYTTKLSYLVSNDFASFETITIDSSVNKSIYALGKGKTVYE